MSITLKNVKCEKKSVVHCLPCRIRADSKAEVKKYFKTTGREDLTATLRGYPLNGKTVRLPSEYAGLIFEVKDRGGDEQSSYTCCGTFDSLHYWNWDKPPSRNDNYIASLDWFDVSKAIHDSVDDSEPRDSS